MKQIIFNAYEYWDLSPEAQLVARKEYQKQENHQMGIRTTVWNIWTSELKALFPMSNLSVIISEEDDSIYLFGTLCLEDVVDAWSKDLKSGADRFVSPNFYNGTDHSKKMKKCFDKEINQILASSEKKSIQIAARIEKNGSYNDCSESVVVNFDLSTHVLEKHVISPLVESICKEILAELIREQTTLISHEDMVDMCEICGGLFDEDGSCLNLPKTWTIIKDIN